MPVWSVFGVQSRANRTVPSATGLAEGLGAVELGALGEGVATGAEGDAIDTLGDGVAAGPHAAKATARLDATTDSRHRPTREEGFNEGAPISNS
jgi:hypothetical protein